MPGPVPKRSEQRRRANKPARELVKPTGAAPAPELAIEELHPLALSLFESLTKSVEARFYTEAVWQRVRVHCYVLSETLYANNGKAISSMMYTALQADWKSFLVDPAEQRRLGIEVQAEQADPDADVADSTVSSLVNRLSG
jgi:hypothetical protein